MAPCEVLDWDSEFFGFGVARVTDSTLEGGSAALIDRWCRERDVGCLYFIADSEDEESLRTATANGVEQVDVRISLRHELDSLPDGAGVEIRDSRASDLGPLTEIAQRSHHDTRFYHDPGFPRSAAMSSMRSGSRRGSTIPGAGSLSPISMVNRPDTS